MNLAQENQFTQKLQKSHSGIESSLQILKNVEKPPETRFRNVRELEQIYEVSKSIFNPCRESGQLVVHLNFAKNQKLII